MAKVATVITARHRIESKPKAQSVAQTPPIPQKAAPPVIKDAIRGVYLITGTGLDELMGGDADELRKKIENDKTHSPLDYRFFDGDKGTWAYWAKLDVDGVGIKPHAFPGVDQYSLTSPQLYTKAVTFPRLWARIIGKLWKKPETFWDKMMKPTTIITAIVIIVLIVAMGVMTLQG